MTTFATSPSIEMARKAIAKFYFRDNIMDVEINGCDVMLSGKLMIGVRLVKVGRRYRFESYTPSTN